MKPIYSLLLWGLKCCAVFYVGSLHASQPLIQDKLPILDIQAQQLSPQQIGLEIGRQSKYIFPDIERRYDRHLSKILTDTYFKHLLKHRLPVLMQQVDEIYQKEMQGVMAAWSIIENNELGDGFLSTDEYLILNLLPNMGFAPNGSGFAAFQSATEDKYSIVGRNMDWESTPELRSLQTITIYHFQEQSIVNIGFSGVVSILTGFNQEGLFLSYFNAASYSPYAKYYKNNPAHQKTKNRTIFSLRKALEKNSTIDSAIRYLSKQTFSNANNILLADKNKVEVLEYSANQQVKIRRWNSATHVNKPWHVKQQIAVVNCNVLAALPNNCTKIIDNYHWSRYVQLAHFSPQNPAKERDISALLFDTYNDGNEIFNKNTLNSVIFIPRYNELYLYAAPIEINKNLQATHQAYLDLLPSSKPENQDKVTLFQILWSILLLLLLIVIWFSNIPAKLLKKYK